MRMNRTKGRRTIFAVVLVIALGLFGFLGVEQLWWGTTGSARLLSIEELPETPDICLRPVHADFKLAGGPKYSRIS